MQEDYWLNKLIINKFNSRIHKGLPNLALYNFIGGLLGISGGFEPLSSASGKVGSPINSASRCSLILYLSSLFFL